MPACGVGALRAKSPRSDSWCLLQVHLFHITDNDTRLTWMSKDNRNRSINVNDIKNVRTLPTCEHICQHKSCMVRCLQGHRQEKNYKSRLPLQLVHGQVTDVFARHPEPARSHLSFSLVYEEDSSVRTLDLTCPTQRDFEYWYFGIKVSEHSQ